MIRCAAWFSMLFAIAASATTFEVTQAGDAGDGSLRRAIELANATPGRDRITFTRDARSFRPTSPLPAITDELEFGNLGDLFFDGSAAGPSDGLVIAANNVSIGGLTVRNFSGHAFVVRGDRNVIDGCLADTNGGDGFVIAGNQNQILFAQAVDDENGIRITGNGNEIYGCRIGASAFAAIGPGNRASGIWIAAGASGNIIGRPQPVCPTVCVDPAGNSIGSNRGPGIRLDGNGNTIDTNEVAGQYNDGIVVTGSGNRVINNLFDANDRNGIVLRAPAEMRNNAGSCNGRLLVDANADGATANDIPDADAVVNAPRLTLAVDRGAEIAISGALDAQPDAEYRVDFLAVPLTCGAGARFVIGSTTVTTDHSGLALLDVVLPKGSHASEWAPRVGATATRLTPSASQPFATSELSPLVIANGDVYGRADVGLRVHALPLMTWDLPATFEIEVTNEGPSSMSDVVVEIPHVPVAIYDAASATRGNCTYTTSMIDICTIGALAAGETVTIRNRVTLPASARFSRFTYTVQARTNRDLSRNQNIYTLPLPVYPPGRSRNAHH